MIVFDIEANGLLDTATAIHCIVLYDTTTAQYKVYHDDPFLKSDGNISDAVRILTSGKVVVGHNICGYDYQLLKKLRGVSIPHNLLYDTLAVCRIRYPEEHNHSLGRWGEKFGIPKPEHEDWSKLSSDMLHRCKEDVKITVRLFNKTYKEVPDDPRFLEQEVMMVHHRQETFGVRLDIARAAALYGRLSKLKLDLEKEITADAPWKCIIPGVALKNQEDHKKNVTALVDSMTDFQTQLSGANPFKGDGSYRVNTLNYFGTDTPTVKGNYSKVELRGLNLNSPPAVKEFLLGIGWKPTEWNYGYEEYRGYKRKVKKSPKLTEESFGSLPPGLGRKIGHWNVLKHRCNYLFNPDKKKGALYLVSPETGRIPAQANTCGTPTARYRHKGVVANVPKKGKLYGEEIREIFCCASEHWFLGLDLKGIEARCLAHFIMDYPGGKELAEIITNGDFHQHNADLWGVDRDLHAKSGLYALMYGCYPKKLASTLGKPESEGQELHDAFWEGNAPIKMLVDDLEKEYDANDGKIRGLDGRWLYSREKRTLLNLLLQNAGTIVFKMWMVKCESYAKAVPWLHQVIAYHDELQYDCHTGDKLSVGVVASHLCKLALEVGVELGLKVETPADPKIGKNWNETH